MKIFGHPIHPLMVHFPTALLPMDLALSLSAYLKHNSSFSFAAFYCLLGGVLVGLAAVATGLIDLFSIPKSNKIAWGAGLIHGFCNGVILLVFAIILYKEWQSYPQLAEPTITTIIIKGILVLALFFGNYLGGNLIYKHHIGLHLNQPENANLTK